MLYYKSLLLLLRCNTGKVRDRCGGMGRFKGGFKCKGWVSSVINYRCNYMRVFFKYKYNVKTCMYTISPLYQIINFNISTWYLKAT